MTSFIFMYINGIGAAISDGTLPLFPSLIAAIHQMMRLKPTTIMMMMTQCDLLDDDQGLLRKRCSRSL